MGRFPRLHIKWLQRLIVCFSIHYFGTWSSILISDDENEKNYGGRDEFRLRLTVGVEVRSVRKGHYGKRNGRDTCQQEEKDYPIFLRTLK